MAIYKETTKEDWLNPAMRLDYVKRLKRERRLSFLDDVVPDRKCPVCKETKIKSRQWVAVTIVHAMHHWPKASFPSKPKVAVCKSCKMKCKHTHEK